MLLILHIAHAIIRPTPWWYPQLTPPPHRNCDVETPCCGKYYACRLCHNENEEHALDRRATTKIKCRLCNTIQPIADRCIEPGCAWQSTFYFCNPCRLWSDDPAKAIYHCEGCGICRLGKRENYFHCDMGCNLCLPIDCSRADHHCVKGASDDACPVCAEANMHMSTSSVVVMACGHVIHAHCQRKLVSSGSNSCPKCRKTILRDAEGDALVKRAILETPMPEEYRDTKCEVLCNDCEKKCIIPFHFYGLPCSSCDSVNTSILKTIRRGVAASGPPAAVNWVARVSYWNATWKQKTKPVTCLDPVMYVDFIMFPLL